MSPNNTFPSHPRPAPLQVHPRLHTSSNGRKLSMITTFEDVDADTNRPEAMTTAHTATSSKKVETPVKRPTTSCSSRSYLLTPESALCSTPQGWQAHLDSEEVRLTFGIELEHLFAYDSSAGQEFKWMLEWMRVLWVNEMLKKKNPHATASTARIRTKQSLCNRRS